MSLFVKIMKQPMLTGSSILHLLISAYEVSTSSEKQLNCTDDSAHIISMMYE